MAEAQKRGRGRPPRFDRQTALKDAMQLFWENGYEGTTFDELTLAMGLSPSSFYNAFGSKEGLYREAAACFVDESRQWILGALFAEGIDTRTAVDRLLAAVADRFTRDNQPRGCMVSLSGTHYAPDHSPIRDLMANYRATSEGALGQRIRQGIDAGDMPADVDVEGLAAFVNALIRGFAVQARDGATREKLLKIGRIAMVAWPTVKKSKARPRQLQSKG